MGKLNHDPQIHHFSHPHPLDLFTPPDPSHLSQISSPPAPCSACKLPLPGGGGYIYTCGPCNYSLHVSCTQFPQLITHPSHPYHTLTLLPTSTYPGGLFNCDACNRRGDGFSYHCSHCDFDLHVICASKPLSVTNPFHPHPLNLAFSSPYEMKGFSCDVCRKIGTNQWLYRCFPCEFDVHLECATAKPAVAAATPVPLQHHHSFPSRAQHQNQFQGAAAAAMPHGNQNHYMHSVSTGGRLQNNYPAASTQVGVVGTSYNTGTTTVGNDLATAVMTGFVEGAAQQVGQTFIQSIIGGGGGGGGGDGSGDSSSFLSSILGGDSDTQN